MNKRKKSVTGSPIPNPFTDPSFLPGAPHQEEVSFVFMPHYSSPHPFWCLVFPAIRPSTRAPGERGPEPKKGHRPIRPEFSRLIIGILLIGVDLGAYYYVENRRREKRVKALLEENARHKLESQQMLASLSPREEDLILHFKADRRIISIDARKIVYVESMSEYVKFHLTDANEPIVVLYSLKNLIGQLPADKFMRIHRSYIISLAHIAEASRTSVRLDNGITLTVGELYRPVFSEYLASCRN